MPLDPPQVFHNNFWTSLDVVVNALDNIKARLRAPPVRPKGLPSS